jgi:hypothetical protein
MALHYIDIRTLWPILNKITELFLGYMKASFINLSLLLYIKMADQPCVCRSCMFMNIGLAACDIPVHVS